MQDLYQDHYIFMLKHLKHQIFHQKTSSMTEKKQFMFMQNILDSDEIQDFNKA